MVTERDVNSLIDAATPLLEPATEAGVGGPLGTPSAQLHRDGFVAGGRLDEKIARLAHVSVDVVGTSWLAWRVGAGEAPSFVVPASGSLTNSFNGQRAATFFIFGGNSSLVFPLADAASYVTKLAANSNAAVYCRQQQSNALRVDVLHGQAYLLYHLHSLHVPSAPTIDERAVFMACAQAQGFRWVFEKPIYLHLPRPVRALGVGNVKPAYEVTQAADEYEPVPVDGELASAPVAKVSVYRVGGSNTGARPWRFAVPQTNDSAALDAFLRVAAVKLAFASGDVNATKYRAFNDDGFALKHTQRLADGDTLYVAPKTWLWVWPSNHVGYKREVKKVPRTDAAGEPAQVSFTLETLGVWPRVFVVRNFLSAAEIKWLYDRSNQTINSPMNPSAAPTQPHEPSTTWLFVTEEQDEVERMEKRVAALLRIAHSEDQFEALVVERYMQKQHRNSMEAYFDVERGTFSHMPMLQFGVNRLVGVYMLIKEPTSGGEIVFPNPVEGATSNAANPCAADATGGIRPKLRVGDAMVYYTLHADQQLAALPRVDRRSIHWHCEVTGGEKWGAFKFAHNRLDPTAGTVGESVKGKKPTGKQ
jgi:prolyl 4-hydroxylase